MMTIAMPKAKKLLVLVMIVSTTFLLMLYREKIAYSFHSVTQTSLDGLLETVRNKYPSIDAKAKEQKTNLKRLSDFRDKFMEQSGLEAWLRNCVSRKSDGTVKWIQPKDLVTMENMLSVCYNSTVKALTPYQQRMPSKWTVTDPVPNIVYFIRFNGKNYKFSVQAFMGMIGTFKIIQPDLIFILGDVPDEDEFLSESIKNVKNLFLIPTEQPEEILGKKFKFIVHASDVVRLKTVIEYGGIYLDNDILPVKPFDDLRQFDFTMGNQSKTHLNNGILLSKPQAEFGQIWYSSYRTFNPDSWAGHNIIKSTELAKKHPNLIHIEPNLQLPNYMIDKTFYTKNLDWSKSYTLHVYSSGRKHTEFPKTLEEVESYNCTAGQAMRYILDYKEKVNNETYHPKDVKNS